MGQESVGHQTVGLSCPSVMPLWGALGMRPGEKQARGGLPVPNWGLCPRDLSGFHQAPGVGDSAQGGASNHEHREAGAPFFPMCVSPPYPF